VTPKLTSSALIHATLRRRIVSVDLKPGSILIEKELADEFGVSRTPVREALQRLAEEHLVDILPRSGTYVSRIDLRAVREALVIRQALERVSVREAGEFCASSVPSRQTSSPFTKPTSSCTRRSPILPGTRPYGVS
jgi:DNA-binding GntR family transcriptional regulator